MKLMPASSARWMIRIESSWSGLPQAPNIIAPRQSGLTSTLVRPSGRISMAPIVRKPLRGLLDGPEHSPGVAAHLDAVDRDGRGVGEHLRAAVAQRQPVVLGKAR